MPLRYESGRSVDEDSGIIIKPSNEAGGDFKTFAFKLIDPRSDVISLFSQHKNPGEFVFYAKAVRTMEHFRGPDGKQGLKEHFLGFELDRKNLQHVFAEYTGNDPARFDKVCTLISEGLKMQLLYEGSGDETTITFV